jgi:hypothetical protein
MKASVIYKAKLDNSIRLIDNLFVPKDKEGITYIRKNNLMSYIQDINRINAKNYGIFSFPYTHDDYIKIFKEFGVFYTNNTGSGLRFMGQNKELNEFNGLYLNNELNESNGLLNQIDMGLYKRFSIGSNSFVVDQKTSYEEKLKRDLKSFYDFLKLLHIIESSNSDIFKIIEIVIELKQLHLYGSYIVIEDDVIKDFESENLDLVLKYFGIYSSKDDANLRLHYSSIQSIDSFTLSREDFLKKTTS